MAVTFEQEIVMASRLPGSCEMEMRFCEELRENHLSFRIFR